MSNCACGAPLPPSKYRPRKWCSERCRKRQYRYRYTGGQTESRRQAHRRWAAKNPERKAAGTAAWHEAHPESRELSGARYRAHKRNAFVENVARLVRLELDDGICGICNTDVDPLIFDVDHIVPLSKGGEHSYANTQVAHPSCNRRKNNKVNAKQKVHAYV